MEPSDIDRDALIVRQALEIEQLKSKLEEAEIARYDIHNILSSIGGPLNGSRLSYTGKQLVPFFDIARAIESL